MCWKKMVYIGFGAICGFRLPLGSWKLSPKDKGSLLHVVFYLATNSAHILGNKRREDYFLRQQVLVTQCPPCIMFCAMCTHSNHLMLNDHCSLTATLVWVPTPHLTILSMVNIHYILRCIMAFAEVIQHKQIF